MKFSLRLYYLQIRYFPKEQVAPRPATYLDIILYSREQIRKENADMGNPDRPEQEDSPWGIISVKAQDVAHELPMQVGKVKKRLLSSSRSSSVCKPSINRRFIHITHTAHHHVEECFRT